MVVANNKRMMVLAKNDQKNTGMISEDEADGSKKKVSKGIVRWVKKLGFWGFMFFLIKGLVWLAIFAFGYFAVK